MGFQVPNPAIMARDASRKANAARVAIEAYKETMDDFKKEIEDSGNTANAAGAKIFAETYGVEVGAAQELGKSTEYGETMVDAYNAATAMYDELTLQIAKIRRVTFVER